MPLQLPTAKDFKELTDLRSLLAFGSGIGIEIGADSLDLVELVMRFEEEFDIEIPDEDAEKIQSVRDAYAYVDQHKG